MLGALLALGIFGGAAAKAAYEAQAEEIFYKV